MVQHVVCVGHLPLFIADHWEAEIGVRNLVNVLDPLMVVLYVVCRQTNQFDATLRELRLKFGKGPQLRRANRSEILRVGEQNDPFVADELVEVDGSIGSFCFEIGRN